MSKIHFTKLDNPFKLIFGDFKTNFKYIAPMAFLSQLFYILALAPKYFENYLHFYPVHFLIFSIISTILFCVFFWRFILKSFGLCLLAKAKIESKSIDVKEIDELIKTNPKKIIKFLSLGAIVGVVGTILFCILMYLSAVVHEVLFDGPFLMFSNFFYKNDVALVVIALALVFLLTYLSVRFFGFSIQSFLFDEAGVIAPYKTSWSMLKNNVFAILFPIILTTIISYIPIFFVFNIVSFAFSFAIPVWVAIFTDFVNSGLFLVLTTLFTTYILTSAYIKAKD